MGGLSDQVKNGRFWLLTSSLALTVISFGLIAWSQTLPGIIFAMVLNAFGGAGTLVALGAIFANRVPKQSTGTVLGIYATAGDLGSALGPMVAYSLLSYIVVENVFVISGVLLLVCLVVGVLGLREE